MVRLRVVDEDGRTPEERAEALHTARAAEGARAALARLVQALQQMGEGLGAGRSPAEIWAPLDHAYEELDRYLAGLLHEAAIDPRCGPGCSACCTDLPPILPIEALRMVRALKALPEGGHRLRLAVDQARAFQLVLRKHAGSAPLDNSSPSYREAQIEWRGRGQPCPALGDDGSCVAYSARPLSCRVHIHVEEPAHCEPRSPRFLVAERPPLWGHPRECEFEVALVEIGRALGLPGVPNLQWGMAALHDHPLS